MKDITFGVLVGTRGFFNPRLASEGRKELIALLDKMGYKYVIVGGNDTKYGVIETVEDPGGARTQDKTGIGFNRL